jgi:hypothetical protein
MRTDKARREVDAYEDVYRVYVQKEDSLTRHGQRPAKEVFKEVSDGQIQASSRLGLRA